MKLGEIIHFERDRRGWSQEELARRAKVSSASVSRIESGNRGGRGDTIMMITAALGINPEHVQKILSGEAIEPASETERTPEEVLQEALTLLRRQRERAEEIARQEQALRARGLVGDVYLYPLAQQAASAGFGYTPDTEMLPFSGPAPKAEDVLFVKVTGDCMEPIIPQGAVVVVDRKRQPSHGDVVLVDHEGEWLCKAYNLDPDGQVWLRAFRHRLPIKPNGLTTVIGVIVKVMGNLPRVVIPPEE